MTPAQIAEAHRMPREWKRLGAPRKSRSECALDERAAPRMSIGRASTQRTSAEAAFFSATAYETTSQGEPRLALSSQGLLSGDSRLFIGPVRNGSSGSRLFSNRRLAVKHSGS